ncbi:hypothetical protein GNIT_2290 [Glaciecola nitratireducens FR1064]|uniref:Uncharacterized protein n=1 Tax=Glaciecola nitratireducens (strain JCM 12485 / KCTC 12276 / FR1064) TaxID=1085623 RepID=G4QKT8_GLANF|nr:hypothetical protein GNIT_2290 [Glaciecola nitratireducens FR1064]
MQFGCLLRYRLVFYLSFSINKDSQNLNLIKGFYDKVDE